MKNYISKQKNVQFNVVNTTSNSIFVNLFNINTLTNTPVSPSIINPKDSVISTIVNPVDAFQVLTNPINNEVWVTGGNRVYVYDDSDLLLASINIVTSREIAYNSIQNTFYILDDPVSVRVVDGSTYAIINTIIIPTTNATGIIFNEANNQIFISIFGLNVVYVIDCLTNTFIATIPLSGSPSSQGIALDTFKNELYVAYASFPYIIDKIDCDTLTLDPINIPILINSISLRFNPNNRLLYISSLSLRDLVLIDSLTDTVIDTISLDFGFDLLISSLEVSSNTLYISTLGSNVINFNCTDNTSNLFNIGSIGLQSVLAVSLNNRLYIPSFGTGNVYVVTTQNIDANTFYISSSGNYNEFLQSIESNPITVDCIRIVSENQNQLSNIISIKQIDADGQSLVYLKNPILQVSSYQKQGNISDINFDGLILDGRTFFSDYKIEPNENVAIEICYEQLIRFNISSMFSDRLINKEKISRIKDEINKKLNSHYNPNEVKFKISKESDKIEISVSNNTVNPSIFSFFNANQNQLIVNNPSVDFANVSDYNYLVQQLRDSPLVLNGIEVISSLDNQLIEPLTVKTKDANGDSVTYHYFPSNEIDSFQQVANRSFIETNNLVLDGYTTFPNYIILPNSNLTFVIYYRQFKRCDLLNNHNFPMLKKPLLSNGMDLSEEMEYYNEVSKKSINIKLNGN